MTITVMCRIKITGLWRVVALISKCMNRVGFSLGTDVDDKEKHGVTCDVDHNVIVQLR